MAKYATSEEMHHCVVCDTRCAVRELIEKDPFPECSVRGGIVKTFHCPCCDHVVMQINAPHVPTVFQVKAREQYQKSVRIFFDEQVNG